MVQVASRLHQLRIAAGMTCPNDPLAEFVCPELPDDFADAFRLVANERMPSTPTAWARLRRHFRIAAAGSKPSNKKKRARLHDAGQPGSSIAAPALWHLL
jgi:hypothetical protein